MKSPAGEFELDTPRGRADTFEPQLIKKHQTHLTADPLRVGRYYQSRTDECPSPVNRVGPRDYKLYGIREKWRG